MSNAADFIACSSGSLVDLFIKGMKKIPFFFIPNATNFVAYSSGISVNPSTNVPMRVKKIQVSPALDNHDDWHGDCIRMNTASDLGRKSFDVVNRK